MANITIFDPPIGVGPLVLSDGVCSRDNERYPDISKRYVFHVTDGCSNTMFGLDETIGGSGKDTEIRHGGRRFEIHPSRISVSVGP